MRGILIVLVVIGHSKASFAPYIYWFHIPAFFMLSGYLFKPVTSPTELKAFIKKKSLALLVPYSMFLVIFLLIRCFYNLGINPHFDIGLEIKNALIGGRVILGVYGTLWFITAFYAAQILYATIWVYGKKLWPVTMLVLACYLLAHFESNLLFTRGHLRPVPLDLDVALLAVAYLHLGKLFKYVEEIYLSEMVLPLYTIIFTLVGTALIYTGATGTFFYRLDLKNIVYLHPLLDLVIPAIFFLAVLGICYYLVRFDTKHIIVTLGLYSLPIMYTHTGIALAFKSITDLHWLLYTAIALPLSFAVGYMLNKWKRTQFLFLGKI